MTDHSAACYLLSHVNSSNYFADNSIDPPVGLLSGESRSLARSIDPIEVPGFDVPAISGMEIFRLRAIASRNGKLRPAPFQIDQKGSKNDWIWNVIYDSARVDDGFDEEASEQTGSQENLSYDDQGPPGKSVFDDNDVVVFLAKDAGDKDRESVMRLGAERLVELEITDPM